MGGEGEGMEKGKSLSSMGERDSQGSCPSAVAAAFATGLSFTFLCCENPGQRAAHCGPTGVAGVQGPSGAGRGRVEQREQQLPLNWQKLELPKAGEMQEST